ncbi:MAG: RsmB/NOP family class I SAM-dependent RNA methyltransferase, partial [Bacteroidota bacterium]|nr:RsmB/NOP family class I SAM-dependent RNA methyltransferase [Bacteroidota bacterium]
MIHLPSDFEKRMQQQLGNDFDSFVRSLDTPSPVSIRINPYKTDKIPDLTRVPWSTTGFYLPARPSFTLDPLFHAGVYYVQEPSSMFVEQVLKQHSERETGRRILDLCAAPGGKSTHILSLIGATDLLVSNEVIRQRSQILAENVSKWGQPNNIVTCNDPSAFGKLKSFFDIILIDAPCSGEGLFRRDAKAMDEWSVDNTRLCAQRQQRIIADVWDSLSDNGILIYSTCTYNPGENEDNLQWISQNYDVEFLSLEIPAEWGIHEIRKGECVGYSFMPHRTQGEGFFLSAIRKRGSELRANPFKDKRPVYSLADKKYRSEAASWLSQSDEYTLIQKEDTLYLFPEEMLPVLNTLNKILYPIKTGT